MNIEEKKYILTRTDDVFIFNEYEFLFHVTNLTKIYIPYKEKFYNYYNATAEELILMKRIKTLLEQLKEHRPKRGLNFLGSALKFITGIPDHDEAVQIESTINTLITNNEKQKIMNSRFEKLLESINGKEIMNHVLLREIHDQLLLLVRTINAAKNNEYLTESLDLDDVKEIVRHEINSVPIINVLEYSDIYIARTDELFITIYKYPVINRICKLFKFTSLNIGHGKISTDKNIALCDKEYIRIKNCKNYLSKNICMINNEQDNCIKPVLENRKAQCKIIQEYNPQLMQIEEGFILLDGMNVVDNQTVTGTKLVSYSDEVKINDITFRNIHNRILEAIHNKHDENLEIIEILASTSNLSFNNLDSLKKFMIPIEEHPVKVFIYSFCTIIFIILITVLILKLIKYFVTLRQIRAAENVQAIYNRELARLTTP